ncbi:hypothetical protein M8J76_010736 [Diaphorina citri]|nr:hypothetical protein M8J76_010736 [Diaphorina citri]KAI5752781.1 hypothetical protein M8J77_020352 [Diaphorina citri]
MRCSKYYGLHLLVIVCHLKICHGEVCSSVVEDITINQCDPNQRSNQNTVQSIDKVPSKDCTRFIDNVSFNVINTEHGIVTYTIVLPSTQCNFSRYMFKLIASNSSLCTHIDQIQHRGNHGNGSTVGDLHSNYAYEYSMKNVRVQFCNDPNTCATNCSNTLYLTFEYVSTQCYQLVVQPFISHDSQLQLYSNWHFIETKYTTIKPHLFAPQFDWRHDQKENSVMVRLIIHANLTTRPLASCVEIMSGVDAIGEHACYETGSRMSQCLVWFGDLAGSPSRCNKERDSEDRGISKCTSEMENELVCTIENVTLGNYCVVMQFLDERCQGSETACSWHKMFSVSNKSVVPLSYSSFSLPFPSSASFSPTILLVFSVLILLAVAATLLVRICHKRSLTMSRYKHFVLPMSRGGSTVVKSGLGEKKILLLYARDCEVVLNAVQAFKTMLQCTGKCQVYDFWDAEDFNSVARNPLAWINSHLSNEEISIIILNTQVAQLLLQNHMPPTIATCDNTAQPKSNEDVRKAFDHSTSGGVSQGDTLEPLPYDDTSSQLVPFLSDGKSNVELRRPGDCACCVFNKQEDTASILSKKQGPSGSLPHSDCGQSKPCCAQEGEDHWLPLLREAPPCQISAVNSQPSLHSCRYYTSKVNVKYKEPKCFDNLFVVGLMSLAQHCSQNPASKLMERVYIVEFDADVRSMCSNFLLPMTLTRFILPQHMENLLYHIHSLSPLSKHFSLDSSDDDYLKFKHSLDLLSDYKARQPQYLLDLLVNAV